MKAVESMYKSAQSDFLDCLKTRSNDRNQFKWWHSCDPETLEFWTFCHKMLGGHFTEKETLNMLLNNPFEHFEEMYLIIENGGHIATRIIEHDQGNEYFLVRAMTYEKAEKHLMKHELFNGPHEVEITQIEVAKLDSNEFYIHYTMYIDYDNDFM